MSRKKHGTFPPPPSGLPERRREFRREDDIETHEIVDHAVEQAPIVNRLFQTSKVAGAVAIVFSFVSGAGAAVGVSVRGPKQDIATLAAHVDTNYMRYLLHEHRIDSIAVELRDMKQDVKTLTTLACLAARARNPDVATAGGCER